MVSDFAKLWIGQTISEVGSRISREGIPYTALLLLHASAGQMGILSATGSAAVLVFGLSAGVAVDRFKKRPLMIAADLGRAALLGLVPLAAFKHLLSMAVLMSVAAAVGILTVLFDVAYQSCLPDLVPKEQLLESNRRLTLSSSTAEMLGPISAGVLVQVTTAPIAILIDALSFLVSALSVWAIRKPESVPQSSHALAVRWEALDGARFIWSHPVLRALLLRSATAFLFMGCIWPLYLLNAIRIVHMSTSALGFCIALGGAGSLMGAALSRRPRFFATAVLGGLAGLFLPLASQFPRYGFALLCVQQFAGDMAMSIYMMHETTMRQSITPPAVIGRVNAAMQLASRGLLPFGALAGGLLADRFGVTATLWIASAGVLLACLWLIPIWNPDSQAGY